MEKKTFEELMDKWAVHETQAAPDISPTEEIYRELKTRQKKSRFMAFPAALRWATAGVAIAATIFIVVFYSDIFPPRGEELTVGLRKGFTAESRRGPGVTPEKGGKRGPKKGPVAFRQLDFQYQKQGKDAIEGFDLRRPEVEKVILTSDDNYRLQFQLLRDRYVYIYQLASDRKLIGLYPNEMYNSIQNPLQANFAYQLPKSPDWFFLDEHIGDETIYVIASIHPQQDLDELYAEYISTKKPEKKQEVITCLLDKFTSLAKKSCEDIAFHKFSFSNQ